MSASMTAGDIHRAVWERFEGVVPMRDGEVDLSAVVMAVLDELERRNFIDVERQEA